MFFYTFFFFFKGSAKNFSSTFDGGILSFERQRKTDIFSRWGAAGKEKYLENRQFVWVSRKFSKFSLIEHAQNVENFHQSFSVFE
jgi:hypothetical protein